MTTKSLNLLCDCGHGTWFDYQVPVRGKPTSKTVKCEGCGSEYETKARRVLLRSGAEKTDLDLKLTRGTDGLKAALDRKKFEERLKLPQKKPLRIFVPDNPENPER